MRASIRFDHLVERRDQSRRVGTWLAGSSASSPPISSSVSPTRAQGLSDGPEIAARRLPGALWLRCARLGAVLRVVLGAVGRLLDRELVAEYEEEVAELGALRVAQGLEEVVFGFALGLGGGVELVFADWCEGDDVAAAVGGVAVAGEVARGFEGVEEAHEDARVYVHEGAEFALGHRAVVVEEAEKMELSRGESGGGVSGAQAAHRLLSDQREQESLAACPLVEDASRAGAVSGRRGGHAQIIHGPYIINMAKLLFSLHPPALWKGPCAP